MKKSMVFGLLLASSFMLNAHCGGCSTDNKKVSAVIQSHVKNEMTLTDLNLSKSQLKKHKEISDEYSKAIEKIRAKYEKQFVKILDKDQQQMYEKKDSTSCLICTEN